MASGDQQQRRPRGRRWVVGTLLLTVLAGAAAGYWFFVRPGGDVAASAHEDPSPGPVFEVGTIITNLDEPGRQVYIQVDLQLEADEASTVTELEARIGAVRNAVLAILRDKTFTEVEGTAGMRQVAGQVRAAVNALLTQGRVREVYFTEFIVQ